MNRNDDILNFLVEGLIAPQRDLVTRAFYRFAEGDPDSAPVNEAILLTACARRVSLAPRELREASADFRKLLAEGREMEARIRERVELSNFGVVSEFKDEARRAHETWRETFRYAKETAEGAEEAMKALKPVILEVRALSGDVGRLNGDVRALRENLKIHDESHQKTVESAQKIEAAHQSIQELVKHLTAQARFNWVTIGFFGGVVFAGIANQFQTPPWEGIVAFGLGIGLIQWTFRYSWNVVRQQAGRLKFLSRKN